MIFPVTKRNVENVSNAMTYTFSTKYSVPVDTDFVDGYIGCQSLENVETITIAYFHKEGKVS